MDPKPSTPIPFLPAPVRRPRRPVPAPLPVQLVLPGLFSDAFPAPRPGRHRRRRAVVVPTRS
jgi:hypothetical protein